LGQPFRQFSLLCFQQCRAGLQQFVLLAGHGPGSRARYAFDAPDAGRNAAFTEQAELAGFRRMFQMGSAAQFLAEIADRNNPYLVGVFFVKQGDRAGSAGLVQGHHFGADRFIFQDFIVDQLFDLSLFLGGQGLEMAEVETQPLSRNRRAGLGDMFADDKAQRLVEQVRHGVVARCSQTGN